MTKLDRYIVRAFVINYVISLSVLISLYVVLDLFFNLDEFTESGLSFFQVFLNVVNFYGTNLFLYFAQLSGVITLFAAMVTLARMQRLNELTAILASGVSLYRVAAPVIIMGLAMNVLWVIDQEVIIPRVAHKIARPHDDVEGTRTYGVWFIRDEEGALLSAVKFHPKTRQMRRMIVIKRDEQGSVEEIITADRATWQPIKGHQCGGLWKLERGIRVHYVAQATAGFRLQDEIERTPIDTFETSLDPEAILLRQSSQWINYVSQRQLSMLEQQDTIQTARITQVRHMRFAAPFVNMLLLVLGIPFFLTREPGNVLRSGALCLLTCGSCFLVAFVVQSLTKTTVSMPALPAWIPLLIFAPIAVVLLDRIKT